MKNQSLKGLAALALAGGLATTSCDLMKDVDYTVTPNPLEMHGDSVRITVEGVLPAKGIKKKVSAEITPMLGGVALRTITVQGEKVEGNGTPIVFKSGGKFSYNDVLAYDAAMENSELTISGVVYKKGKEKSQFGPEKIADATIITPLLVQFDNKVILAADQFKRVTEESTDAQINYEKNMSNVRAGELTQADIKAFESFLVAAQANPKITPKAIKILAYASPEGEEGRNNELSTARSESAKAAIVGLSKKAKCDFAADEASYQLQAKGEDWQGFKTELEKSAMVQDEKDLVLRVLSMYSDPAQREKEMRNMAKTFDFLEKNVLPQLRRSQIALTYDLSGYSDEELLNLLRTNPSSLKLEELYFVATLTEDLNEKLKAYKEAEARFPECWRAPNNVGYILFVQGKTEEAKAEFEKSNGISENPQALNNLGVIAHINGDREKAKSLYRQAMSAGSEVKYNMGIAQIQDGNYDDAVGSFGGAKTFNKALAQVLAGNGEGAAKTLDESEAKEDAMSDYLRAIIAARKGDEVNAINNLKSAFGKDASLKAKAVKDREFIKMFENSNFLAIIK
jgi:tetratricopeptide (TPR) repeat protein